ncbi:MAG: hypothetical protein GY853_14415 [PVC group bacterium]|nr:hypothetical protein [PVC group bacterium]
MRKTLFRGFDGQKWVYGYYQQIKHKSNNELWDHITTTDIKTTVVLGNTVGQYTGLKDKNKVKIFEGDIIELCYKGWDPHKKIFGWSNHRLAFSITNIEDLKFNDILEIQQFPAENWYKRFLPYTEVIGNIHDNPELMK